MSEMMLVPVWFPVLFVVLNAVVIFGSWWFDHYSSKRLREATDYWRRSGEILAAIYAVENPPPTKTER